MSRKGSGGIVGLPKGAEKTIPTVVVCMPYYHDMPKSGMIIGEQLASYGVPGYRTYIVRSQATIIEFARNEMIGEAVKDKADFLFFLDADLGYNAETLSYVDKEHPIPMVPTMMAQILDHNLDICGGMYVTRKPPHPPNVFNYIEGVGYPPILDPPMEGVHEVDGIATGFLAIKMSVFDAFWKRNEEREKRWSQFQGSINFLKNKLDSLPSNTRAHVEKIIECYETKAIDHSVRPPFWVNYHKHKYTNDWRMQGEDVFFCHQARELGFKVHCDFSIQIGHESSFYITPEQYVHAYKDEYIVKTRDVLRGLGQPFIPGIREK